ncbi:MAG: FtsQ-type POTRA domain-containing protein [Alphaproteobacteria bacterium]|nr:FtsQ-type POTRA domain-containing protein [Alphaproteobacteria bacterium]
MRRSKSSPLRGSVSQNNVSVRMRAQEKSGAGFLTRLGILAAVALVIIGVCVALWQAGWPQEKFADAKDAALIWSQKAHFAVRDIEVEGRHMSRREDVYDALGTEQGAPIFAFDAENAAAHLAKLPWVDSAVVERRLPDTVAVILTERVPTARWQHDEKTYVIDGNGRVLPSANPDDFAWLPLLVGLGADSEAQAFLTLLGHYPDIQKLTQSAVRVSERRWDLHLQANITVRLPEQDVGDALHRLSVLIAQKQILDRNVAAVDLRFPDKLVIEPAPAKTTGDARL